jgi:hypothetical protein
MSESSEEYTEVYGLVERAKRTAQSIAVGTDRHLLAPMFTSERDAIAYLCRETARWFSHLAERIDLEGG